MTLQARIETMASRIRREFDATNARIGNLALLATANKTSLVAAVNEVRAMQSTGVTISADPGNALAVGTDGGLHCHAAITSTLNW